VHGISFSASAGALTALIGANGAGKSSTLAAISGLVRPSGRIRFSGRDIAGSPAHVIVREGIVQVPEGREILARMTVEENLLMGLRGRDRAGLASAYERFPILAERRATAAGSLSGGEQQMLAIARCLMMKPKLIIFDEPTEGIMPKLVSDIRREIHRINESGVSVLLVEQNVKTALKLCSRVFIMEKGTIVHAGASHELKAQPELVHRYLGLSL